MKIRRIPLLLAAAALLLFSAAYAQNKTVKGKTATKQVSAKASTAPTKPIMDVTLGHSERVGGNIPKREFDMIAPQGVRIKDANGAFIEGFSFTYGERNLYEDSAGNPKPVTDYLTEYCMGDTLSPIISQTIADRTKPGDTAYYDDIHIRMPNGKPAIGKPMKFVITR